MTNRPTDPPPPDDERDQLLAAYVDGEATPDERAVVDADPALVDRAEQFRAAKERVADVAPLPAARRDELIAAAVGERRVVAPAPPSRRVPSRWLAVAAAVVAIAGGAAVVGRLGTGTGDDDDAGSAASVLDTGETEALSSGGDEQREADDAPTERAEDLAGATAGTAAPATTGGSELTASAAPAGTAADSAADTTTPARASTIGDTADVSDFAEPPTDGQLAVVTGRRELAEWFDDVNGAQLRPPGAESEQCDENVLGWALYQPSAAGEDTPASIYVVIVRRGDRQVEALDASTCETVLVVDVP